MYDSNPKIVITGGFGFSEPAGENRIVTNRTYADTGAPIKTAGTLKRIRTIVYRDNNTATIFKFKIVRWNTDHYDLVGTVDAAIHMAAALTAKGTDGQMVYDTAATYGAVGPLSMLDASTNEPIEVLAGDIIAVSFNADLYIVTTADAGGFGMYYSEGDNVTLDTEVAGVSLRIEAHIETDQSLIFDSDNGEAGYAASTTPIQVPGFYNRPYWVFFQDVVVPDGEDLRIQARKLNFNLGSAANDISILIDMASSPQVIEVRSDVDGLVSSVEVPYIANDKWDIAVLVNPASVADNSLKCNIVNYTNGRGYAGSPVTPSDIRHISVTNQQFVARPGNGELNGVNSSTTPARIQNFIVSQVTGVGASIGNIAICEKPFVVVGDSFTSQTLVDGNGDPLLDTNGETILANTSLRFKESSLTTEGVTHTITPRYVVNGGRAGNLLVNDDGSFTSIAGRVFGSKQALIDYPYSVYIFVNGPGVNDLANVNTKPITLAEAAILGESLPTITMAMAKAALYARSEVVLCEMSYIMPPRQDKPSPYYQAGITDLATLTYNENLNKLAGVYRLPLAKPSLTLKADVSYYSDDNLHLGTTGWDLMAWKIIEAYEQNITGKYARIINYGD